MQAVKSGWGGQTVALARCSDSGGKKPRNRRTKEERKTMVESFIKKYQTLNNGSFPSLNLTHKEVGGSFYTVREIFREIIQENRVLGPASSSSEEQTIESFSGEFASGLQSPKYQSPLSLSSTFWHAVDQKQKDIILLSNGQYSISEELFTTSSGESVEKSHEMDEYKEEMTLLSDSNCSLQLKHGESDNDLQQNFDNDQFLSEKYLGVDEERQSSKQGRIKMQKDKLIHTELEVNERQEVAENLAEAAAAAVTSVLSDNEFHSCKDKTQLHQNNGAPVMVSDMRPRNGLDPQMHGSLIDPDVGKESYSTAGAVNSIVDDGTASKTLVNVETSGLSPTVYVGEAIPLASAAATPCSLNGRPEEVQDSGVLEVQETNHFPKTVEVNLLQVNSSSNLSGMVSPDGLSADILDGEARAKTANLDLEVDASNTNVSIPQTLDQSQLYKGVEIEKVADTSNNGVESLVPDIKDASELEAEAEVIRKSSTKSGTGSVLDGASSGSSAKATEKPYDAERNPFLAIIKSFVTALVKFWVE